MLDTCMTCTRIQKIIYKLLTIVNLHWHINFVILCSGMLDLCILVHAVHYGDMQKVSHYSQYPTKSPKVYSRVALYPGSPPLEGPGYESNSGGGESLSYSWPVWGIRVGAL